MPPVKIVTIISGGLDSTVLAYMNDQVEGEQILVSFDYGQRHVKELDYAQLTALALHAEHIIIPMGFMRTVLTGSALTDSNVAVPLGHYAEESMKATVVPNRNSIMLSIATGIAVAEKASCVATAVHAGDHPI